MSENRAFCENKSDNGRRNGREDDHNSDKMSGKDEVSDDDGDENNNEWTEQLVEEMVTSVLSERGDDTASQSLCSELQRRIYGNDYYGRHCLTLAKSHRNESTVYRELIRLIDEQQAAADTAIDAQKQGQSMPPITGHADAVRRARMQYAVTRYNGSIRVQQETANHCRSELESIASEAHISASRTEALAMMAYQARSKMIADLSSFRSVKSR